MDAVIFDAVTKVFRERRGFLAWPRGNGANLKTALRDVTLSIPAGKVLVLLGPNGSGKTTLLKLVSTMLLPDSGRILVQGADTLRQSDRARRHMGIAVASERSFFPRLSARENLEFFATLDDVPRNIRRDRIERVLQTAGLSDAADKQVMTFSSGMYQRLGTARALLKNPSVLLLDEPTRSLDPGGTWRLWQLLRRTIETGTTILLATHNFEEAATIGQHVVVLRQGEVAAERRVGHQTSIEDLRSFYFREIEPESAEVPGEVR